MSNDKNKREYFTRRALLLGAGKFGFMSVLLGRLFYLQIIDSTKYKSMSEDNCISNRYLLPERGEIVDRIGRPLAASRENYRLLFMPEQIKDFRDSFAELSKVIDLSDHDPDELYLELKRNPQLPVTLYEDLTWKNIIKVETYCAELPGIVIEKYKKRYYTDGPILSSIMGYIGPMNTQEKENYEGVCLPEIRLGKCGIEKQYEDKLKGNFGERTVEVNSRGRVVRELNLVKPESGQLLNLALDYELQDFTYKRLNEMPGASVTLDVKTGGVLSLVSSPGYDPHLFLNGINTENWRGLNEHPYTPMINRVIQGCYPPGSIFKIAVALAGLEKGVIKSTDQVFCGGSHAVGNTRLHCHIKGGHGSLDVKDALAKSCDIYFYVMAERMGIEAIAAMAKKLGLGSPTGLDMPGERSGLVPTPAWKRERYKQPWHKAETMMVGIGQSYMMATPLQLAVMMARVVSGGRKIVPHLYQDPDRSLLRVGGSLDISPESLAIVMDALNRVTNVPGGTGYKYRIQEHGFEMAGKSSTSQVKRITKEERMRGVIRNENREWKDRDHALFCGFAPVHDPRFVTATIVEHGGFGSKAAAPVVRDILMKAQKLILTQVG